MPPGSPRGASWKSHPRFSVSGFVRMELFRPQLTAAIAAALTRAGLPEDPAG